MKLKYFLLMVCIIIHNPYPIDAKNLMVISAKVQSESGSCDTCTGTLVFSSHFENNDNIEQGTPCGCSTNVTKSWTRASTTYSNTQASDGTYSILRSGTSKYATIPATIEADHGKIVFDIYITTWVNYENLITIYVAADNKINFYLSGNDEIMAAQYLATDGGTTSISLDFSTGLSVNAWHTVSFSWTTDTNTASLKMVIDDGATTKTFSTDAWLNKLTSENITLKVGEEGVGTASVFYIDNLKIYNTYSGS